MISKQSGQSSEYYLMYEVLKKLEQITKIAPNIGWGAGGLLITEFGAKSDFVTTTASTNGTSIVNVSNYSLSIRDIGKIITIFDCTKKPSYSGRILSLTTVIIAVINSTTCIVQTAPTENTSGKKCYIGTNNFDPIQIALNYCFNNNVHTLIIPSGTYYVVPKFSIIAPTQGSIKGLQIRGDINIIGRGKNTTILKFGAEDISEILDSSVMKYKGIYFRGDGRRLLKDFSIIGADRTTTAITNPYTDAVYTDQTANVDMHLTFQDFSVLSKDGWGNGFSSSRGGTYSGGIVTKWYNSTFNDCVIEAYNQPVSYFAQDGPTKRINMSNVILKGGGGKPMPNMIGTASITSGTKILNISDPNFSFYDLRSQVSFDDRMYDVLIGGTFSSKIVSINSPTQAVLVDNAPSTFSGANIDFTYSGGDLSEGHCVYMHPNVTYNWNDVELRDSRKLSFRTFSSGGQVGIPIEQELTEVSEFPDVTLASAGGCQFNTNMIQPVIWNNCDFRLNQSDIYDVIATDTNIKGGQHYGNATLYGCTGIFDSRADGKTIIIDNGEFTSLVARAVNSDFIITDTICTSSLSFQEKVASFSWIGGYLGYMSIGIAEADIATFPDIELQDLISNGSTIGFALFSNSLSLANQITLNPKFQISNSVFDAAGGLTTLFEFSNNIPLSSNINSSDVTAASVTVSSQKKNEYESWRHLGLKQQYGVHTVTNTTQVIQTIWPSAINSNGSVGNHVYNQLNIYKGSFVINCGAALKFRVGGMMRLKRNGDRVLNETITFIKDEIYNVYIETNSTVTPTSTSIPIHIGVINERVDNTLSPGNYWLYQVIENPIIGELHSLALATTTFEFNLSNAPYIGLESQIMINPETLMTITIPLNGGGTLVLNPDVYGHLNAVSGASFGDIRLSDGHIKITFSGVTPDILGNLSVDYVYLSGGAWNAF